MNTPATPFARQILRDERSPRIERIHELGRQTGRCFKAKAYDAALAMQFIELDTWAYLTRPADMKSRDNKKSFTRFTDRYLRDEPGSAYSYAALDIYTARCALLHTFGSTTERHTENTSVVIWRYHLGLKNTYVPGLEWMAYISLGRFIMDAKAAIGRCLNETRENPALSQLFGNRLPRLYFLAGVLPNRDPEAVAALDPGIDAEIAELDGVSG